MFVNISWNGGTKSRSERSARFRCILLLRYSAIGYIRASVSQWRVSHLPVLSYPWSYSYTLLVGSGLGWLFLLRLKMHPTRLSFVWSWIFFFDHPLTPLALEHPHLRRWGAIGHKYKQRWHGHHANEPGYAITKNSTCNVQVVRSVSDWSHGVLTEASIQNACRSLSQ